MIVISVFYRLFAFIKLGLLFSTPYDILLLSYTFDFFNHFVSLFRYTKSLVCQTTALLLGAEVITEMSHIHLFSKFLWPPELSIQSSNALHRDDTGYFKSIYVCLNHFNTTDIIKIDRVMQADGNFTMIVRARPSLCQNAVPSILHGCLSYLS